MPTLILRAVRPVLALALLALLAGCGPNGAGLAPRGIVEGYGPGEDGGFPIAAIDPQYLGGVNRRTEVDYNGPEGAGTIVVDPHAKFLYHVAGGSGGATTRYPIAVGAQGKGFRGSATVGRKAAWPGWTPTANMIRNEPELYADFAGGIEGGPRSPLGARALYLYRGGRDTYFRIHGTNDSESIGNASSAGCIRLFNQDIIHLYDRVSPGAQVVVRSYEESVALEGADLANRGDELPPAILRASHRGG